MAAPTRTISWRVPAAAASSAASKVPKHMFVLGTGFVGRYVSERLLTNGWEVSGTCTSIVKKRELEKLGMNAFIFEAKESNLTDLHTLEHATHLLISIPPISGIRDPLLSSHEDLQRILNRGNLQWLCYLSSTSVYGDCGGAWVDEDHLVNPKSGSAKLRYAAEKGWLDLVDCLDLPAFVFRLGGIYGPGRRKIYNVVDDDPASRTEVFAFARNLIERRYPDLIQELCDVNSEDVDSPKDIAGEKRVSNARLKQELGVKLLHSTYRSGLQSILDSWQVNSAFLGKVAEA